MSARDFKSASDLVLTPTSGGHFVDAPIALSVALRGREGGATAELGDEIAGCLRASGGGGDKAHVLAPIEIVSNSPPCSTRLGGPIAFDSRQDCVSSTDVFGSLGSSSPQAQAVAFNDVAATLKGGSGARGYPDPSDGNGHSLVGSSMAVRRLTPVECARLQGFPDDYLSQVMVRGKPMADGPMYKALGNSWAVPVVRWIGKRIHAQMVRGEA